MQEQLITNPEFENQDQIKGFEAYDYECAAIDGKTTQKTVFELINATVSAAEAEKAYSIGVPSLEHAPLTWEATRTAEFCAEYDDFINAPDFELDVFGVLKLDMENFWASLRRNADRRAKKGEDNSARVLNAIETVGKSTVYQFGNNKVTFGYLANNMTYDGQYSYVLTSAKAGGAARRCFKGTKAYPAEINAIGGARTRWGKVIAKLEASGETAIGAWAVLEEDDSKVFYGEMKRHNWLSASDKQLLKAVRRAAGGLTFDLYIESLEDRKSEIEAKIEDLEQDNFMEAGFIEYMALNLSAEAMAENQEVSETLAGIQANNVEIIDLREELDEIEAKLLSADEEDNSQAAITETEAYDNWNYYEDGGY